MEQLYGRPVLFVRDASAAAAFYCKQLGFGQDWVHEEQGEVVVVQVSRWGYEIILNRDTERAGKGRIFFSLCEQQKAPLRESLARAGVPASQRSWGMAVTEVRDPDGNELLLHPPLLER